jgi:hypothetical protein
VLSKLIRFGFAAVLAVATTVCAVRGAEAGIICYGPYFIPSGPVGDDGVQDGFFEYECFYDGNPWNDEWT